MDIVSYAMGKKAGGGTQPTGTIDITNNGTTNVSSYAYADVNVQPDLESKQVTIGTNTVTTIRPTEGKDGLSSVEVTTNVPQPSGKIEITENGTDIDVSSYSTADVNVGGKYAPRYTYHGAGASLFKQYTGTELLYETRNLDTTNFGSFNSFFYECTNLTQVDCSEWNTENADQYYYMFYGCSSLTSLDLRNFTCKQNASINQMFIGCTSLMHLDMRNFEFTKSPTPASNTYTFGSLASNYVPANCEIIVKDNTQKQWFATYYSRLTNVKTVAEYEG